VKKWRQNETLLHGPGGCIVCDIYNQSCERMRMNVNRPQVIKRTADNEHKVYCWARAIINVGEGELQAVFHNIHSDGYEIIAVIDHAIGFKAVDEGYERLVAAGIYGGVYNG